jgi:hypothetical protein
LYTRRLLRKIWVERTLWNKGEENKKTNDVKKVWTPLFYNISFLIRILQEISLLFQW